MTIGPGSVVGKYVVVEKIGEGGMSEVFLAKHPELDRQVVIKIARMVGSALAPDLTTRFEREAAIIAHFDHPNILALYHAGIADRRPWMALEYVDGENLDERLRNGLGIDDGFRILRDAAQALDYAHANSIVHRDIKPSNILVSQTGHVYLADFGIAMPLVSAAGAGATAGHARALSLPYASPEQINGQSVDVRSDIYSLAILCFQWLTGSTPFKGTAHQVCFQHVHEPLPEVELRALKEGVSAELRKGADKVPANRHERATTLIEALERATRATAPTHDLNVATSPEPRFRFDALAWIAIASVAATASLGTAAFLDLRGEATRQTASVEPGPERRQNTSNAAATKSAGVVQSEQPVVEKTAAVAAVDTPPAPDTRNDASMTPEQLYAEGLRYFDGDGVAKDDAKARSLILRAAESGLAEAQRSIGNSFLRGIAVEPDTKQASQWYEKAANQGLPDAQSLLADRYYFGDGVAKDYSKALYWYRQAAAQDDRAAQCYLGKMLYRGEGVAVDKQAGFRWLLKSAELGFAEAQYLVSLAYEAGEFVERDSAKAKAWRTRAVAQGYWPNDKPE